MTQLPAGPYTHEGWVLAPTLSATTHPDESPPERVFAATDCADLCTLTLDPMDTADLSRPQLTFWWLLSRDMGSGDLLELQARQEGQWETLRNYRGSGAGVYENDERWHQATVPLDQVVDSDQVHLRFRVRAMLPPTHPRTRRAPSAQIDQFVLGSGGRCGDDLCDTAETCQGCPSDCGECEPGTVLIGAGDIANCADREPARATGQLVWEVIQSHEDVSVFTLGDNVYPDGTLDNFTHCYAPTWGRFRSLTRPAVGNHEYYADPDGAAPYFDYFGEAAGGPDGFYGYDVGEHWRVIVLNSNCDAVACTRESEQGLWLRDELEQHADRCTAVLWHHPRFSSGVHGDSVTAGIDVRDLWRISVEGGADLALAGHDHTYERFGPVDGEGMADAQTGLPSFVVGGGGGVERSFMDTVPDNSLVRIAGVYGVLRLDLDPGAYRWSYLGIDGMVHDEGQADCR